MPRLFFGLLTIFVVTLACSRDDTASAHPRTGPGADDGSVAPRPSVVGSEAQPYRVVPVAASGTITGTVDIDGAAPVIPVIHPTSDQNVCGNTIAEKRLPLAGTRVGGAIVWLTDIADYATDKPFKLPAEVQVSALSRVNPRIR